MYNEIKQKKKKKKQCEKMRKRGWEKMRLEEKK